MQNYDRFFGGFFYNVDIFKYLLEHWSRQANPCRCFIPELWNYNKHFRHNFTWTVIYFLSKCSVDIQFHIVCFLCVFKYCLLLGTLMHIYYYAQTFTWTHFYICMHYADRMPGWLFTMITKLCASTCSLCWWDFLKMKRRRR